MVILVAIIQAIVCGFLCAMCHPNVDALYDIISESQPPKNLIDYIDKHLNLSTAELVKHEDYSVLIEINKEYGSILALFDKMNYYLLALQAQKSMPIGYILSVVFVCLCAIGCRFNGISILIVIACNIVSHIFFFKWNEKRIETKAFSNELNWSCKLYSESVYTCICQARMTLQRRYDIISSVYGECKTGRQIYLALLVLFAIVMLFNF